MRIFLVLCLCTIGLVVPTIQAQRKTVQLELHYYQPYCGGARPTEEIEQEAKKPKPYAEKKMILVGKNKIDTIYTNEKGKLKLKLKKGSYQVFEPWRFRKQGPNGQALSMYDQNCLGEEWKKPTAIIKVEGKKVKIEFKNELTEYCEWAFPCLLEAHMPPLRD